LKAGHGSFSSQEEMRKVYVVSVPDLRESFVLEVALVQYVDV